MTSDGIDVYIADDQDLIRDTLVALLSLADGIRVAGESDRGDTVLEDVLRLDPDVTVLSAHLPGFDAVGAVALLREKAPQTRILMLTCAHPADGFRSAVEAGVHGFMVRDAPAYRVVEAVRAVARGERVIDVELYGHSDDGGGC